MSSHRPLVGICLCFAAGIAVNEYTKFPFGLYGALAAASLILSMLFRHRSLAALFLAPAIVFTGALFSQNFQLLPPDHIRHLPYYYYHKDPVTIEGLLVSDVEKRPFFKRRKLVFTLQVDRIRTRRGWQKQSGKILVNLFREDDLRYGDYVRIEGKLHWPFNFSQDSPFSYREYLARKGIMFILSVKRQGSLEIIKRGQGHFVKDLSLRLKARLCDVLNRNLPREEAGIMRAFLLGDRADIPPSVYELFKLSGVAHIIAISGFNIGIVATVITLILRMFPIPRAAQYILTMALLVFYAFLTGGQPPVVRATIMAVIFLSSFIVEREHESVNTLSAAALVLLLMNPLNLFDVGSQLSFVSVLAIILLYPRFLDGLYKLLPGFKDPDPDENDKLYAQPLDVKARNRVIGYFLQSMALSLAAYLGVVALILYYFQIITPVVLAANLIIIPLASLIIFLGLGLFIVSALFPFLVFTFSHCITVLLNLMVGIVFLCVQVPGAYFECRAFPLWMVFVYYGLAALLFSLFGRFLIPHPGGRMPEDRG